MKLHSLLTFSLFLAFFSCNAQNTISGIVNDYTSVLGFFDCDNSLLQVGSTAGFSAGDEVLIIQMQGAAVNTSNSANFGNITDAGNAGNFELNRIESISGNQIRLLNKPQNTYDVAGKVQLVRVPEYDDASASALTCKAWDGSTGGVLIIDVSGTLTLQNGAADVSEKGFRGGIVADGSTSFYHETDYFYSPNPDLAAAKGEGIAIIPTNLSYGRGKVANGGGGGNAHNAGGGGGGNAGAGGNGGSEYWFAPNSPTPGTNGIGGLKIFDVNSQKIALGGGGGAGHANDLVSISGGNGGGIIILKANNIIASSGGTTLTANGEDIITSGDLNNDGQGGGGAGGSIFIQANQITGSLNCELKGGRGGDCLFYVVAQIIGPGGGGGGGKLMLSQNFPNVVANLDGGINGFANQNQTNDAQPGQTGIKLTGATIFEDTIPAGSILLEQDIAFCPGSSVTIDGITYTQPGTVVDTIPGISGCDTVVTYNLQYSPLDLVFHINEVSCSLGKMNMEYSICNLGSGDFPLNAVDVTFYDANPLTGPANVVGNLSLFASNTDSCYTELNGNISQIIQFVNGQMLYSVVNFDGSLPTPFSFDDFPVTAIEECNYTNNLDSFLVQLPASPTLDLGSDVILCVDSTVVFDAGAGFYKYLWQDGSESQTFAATASDVYWVEVTDSCGFKQRDSVLLSVSLLTDTQFPDTSICAGESVSLSLPGFDTYNWSPATGLSCTDCADVTISPASTTTYTLLAVTTDGCVLEDTFTVTVLPVTTVAQTIEFCPGESVTIDGEIYTQSGTVIDTTTGPNGCDLITTYTLVLLAQPVLSEVTLFCKGDTVFIGGTAYTQPGTVVDTLPAATGCDTIATYSLQYLSDPNATVSIDCISDIDIASQPGTGPIVVDYDLPVTASDCPCPGVGLTLTQGLPPGSLFPVTTTKVCYEAKDSCGNTASCCFNVTIREELPCDVKEIGCMKYELLDIKRNASDLNLTYRIRVTNNCANKMIYTAIQIPDGMVAVEPANNSVYVSPAGRDYDVRNPNFSPFYSIRFKSKIDSIANGQADIFEYTLPPQINPAYIHITARLYPQIFHEAHFNTFNCPIEIVNNKPAQRTDVANSVHIADLHIFPNPTSGSLFTDLSDWQGERVYVRVFDSQGKQALDLVLTAAGGPQEIQLPEEWTNGLYFLEIVKDDGEKRTARFVVQR